MKRLLLLGSVLFCVASIAQAKSQDICSSIPGIWKGTLTIKNIADCKQYKGCIHSINADVKHLSGTTYQVNLKPSVGEGDIFNINCEQGKINSTTNPGNAIQLNCSSNLCTVNYDDAKQTARMVLVEKC